MKKSQLKRTMALFLTVSMLLAEATGVFAGTVNMNDGKGVYVSSGEGVTAQTEQPLGTPFTDVTEDEALAFERGLDRELSGVTGADTLLSKNAKKKAAALVSLYGETSVQYALMQNGELLLSETHRRKQRLRQTLFTG